MLNHFITIKPPNQILFGLAAERAVSGSPDIPHVKPQDSIAYCMKLMADSNVRYLPVFENSMLIDIISILDVIQETVDEQKETIGELQSFIYTNYVT